GRRLRAAERQRPGVLIKVTHKDHCLQPPRAELLPQLIQNTAQRSDLAGGLELLSKMVRVGPPLAARCEPHFAKLARRMAIEGEHLDIGVLAIDKLRQ